MAISSTAKVVIGAAVAAALGIGIGIAATGKPAAAAPSSGPPTPTPGGGAQVFKAGERYAIAIATTVPLAALDVATTQAALNVIAPGTFRVAMVTPAFNMPTVLSTYTVDVLQPFTLSSTQGFASIFSGGAAMPLTVTVTDLGPSPTSSSGPAPVGPGPTLPPAISTSTPPVGVPPIMPPPAATITPGGAAMPSAQDAQIATNRASLGAGTASYVPMPQTGGSPAGSRIRITVTNDAYRAAAGIGFGPGGRIGFAQFFASSALAQQFTGPVFFVWAPGDALPPDWPSDDAHAADGWHVELYYRNASLALTAPMIPAGLGVDSAGVGSWVGQSNGGPTKVTGTGGGLSWSSTDTIEPGAHVRLSFAPADIATIANAVGFTGAITGPSCAGFLTLVAQTGFDAVVTGAGAVVLAWCGDDLLPPDWPPQDDLGNYHLETRYQGSSAIAVASLPFPVAGAWVAEGPGA